MKRLKDTELLTLVEEYRAAACAHGDATEHGDHKRANREHDKIAAVHRELRGRGADALRALLPLLDDTDPGVRYWAGAHALDFAPQDGERALVAMSEIPNSLVSFSAATTLREWRAGRLRFQ
jgi:hypothetical protein